MGEALRKPREHRLPDDVVATAFPGVHDASLGVDEDEMGLVVGTEPSRPCPLGILDRGPGPSVALDEGAPLFGRVGDIDAEVVDLRVILFELCVGDRLALTRASPRRPHVDQHRSAPEVGQRDRISVQGDSVDRRRRLSAELRRLGLADGRRRDGRVVTRAAAACRRQRCENGRREDEGERSHARHCSPEDVAPI